jgi:pterin-4a-carbinolamine dehydratase/MFS family permease
LLGGLLVDTLNWRWIFAVNVVPVVVTLLLAGRLIEPARPAHRPRIDLPGAVLAAAGLAGTVYALIEGQRLGFAEPAPAVALAAGIACLIGLLWREMHTDHPMIPLPLFRIRNFGVGNLATTFIYAGVSMGMLIVALFLQEVVGYSALLAGLATLPVPVLSFVIARPIGALAAKHGPHIFMAAGPIIAGGGYLLMLTAGPDFNFWAQMLPGLVLFGIGLSVTVTPLTSAILAAVNREQSGIGSAINNAISRVSGLVAVACTGIVVGGQLDYEGFRRVALVTAVLFIVGGVISATGIRNRDHTPGPHRARGCSRVLRPGHRPTPPPMMGCSGEQKRRSASPKQPIFGERGGNITAMAQLLNESEITQALADLPNWFRDGDSLTVTVDCPDFPAAIAYVGRVAEAAEAADHHPDIDIRWRTVTFTLSTHSDGGITGKDTALAHQINDLAP